MKYYLAIDIGASSGRHIIGWRDDKKMHTDEVYRFQNGVNLNLSGGEFALIYGTKADNRFCLPRTA